MTLWIKAHWKFSNASLILHSKPICKDLKDLKSIILHVRKYFIFPDNIETYLFTYFCEPLFCLNEMLRIIITKRLHIIFIISIGSNRM